MDHCVQTDQIRVIPVDHCVQTDQIRVVIADHHVQIIIGRKWFRLVDLCAQAVCSSESCAGRPLFPNCVQARAVPVDLCVLKGELHW